MDKIYIARERDKEVWIPEEGWETVKGDLIVFYDTPLWAYDENLKGYTWTNARKLGTIPNYMYPNITFKNSPAIFQLQTSKDE